MGEPNRRWRGAAMVPLFALMAGCAVVPRSRLEDCHKLSQRLQAETLQLKDSALRLREQNHDLTQRAVDDARRLRTVEGENRELKQSILAYQENTRRIEAEFDRIKRLVEGSPSDSPLAGDDAPAAADAPRIGTRLPPAP
jgi:chemotaxis protein MotB